MNNNNQEESEQPRWFEPFKRTFLTFARPTPYISTFAISSPQSSATYYPAGSALLKEEDRTFENYKNLFADEINADRLSEIESLENKADAKKHFEEEFKKFVSSITKHSIMEKILLTAIIIMVFSLPLAIFIEDSIKNAGLESINYTMLGIYYVILIIITIVTYFLTNRLAYEIKQLELTLDFTKYKGEILD